MAAFDRLRTALSRLKPKQARESPDPVNSKCPLFRFPAEIRNTIWEMALDEEKEIVLSCATSALLQTCKQMRKEASAMWLTGQTVVIRPAMQQYVRNRKGPSQGKRAWRKRVGRGSAKKDLGAFLVWHAQRRRLAGVDSQCAHNGWHSAKATPRSSPSHY
ncbi:hypothetical protein LTR36_001620 [Oleoguttula mirabilis]|uniref:F-box domain-containing protein n=1 Tax=Oleoguttula mirabilis TaxID=1507867 RepID=A0AAV9JNF5_9PEZI|nr:hypothetical protein LTR36_001620 [Oleoguttula mirabilis]